jgi:hypothetical protein
MREKGRSVAKGRGLSTARLLSLWRASNRELYGAPSAKHHYPVLVAVRNRAQTATPLLRTSLNLVPGKVETVASRRSR